MIRNKVKGFLIYLYVNIRELLFTNYIARFQGIFKNKHQIQSKKNTIYIVTTPEYGNIGDHAIADAEIRFSKMKYPGYRVIEIPDSKFDSYIYGLWLFAKKTDMIFLIGGGNFGTMYLSSEIIRRTIIRKCKRNRIVMFPQSVAINNTFFDYLQMKKSSRIYSAHKHILLLAREKNSHEYMKNVFSANQIIMAPDIVLTKTNPGHREIHEIKKVMFCIRNDSESEISQEKVGIMREWFINRGYEIVDFDTETYGRITTEERPGVLNKTYRKFKSVDFVVTDRLHGMIISVVSGTPCMALDNSTKKISGLYDSIRRPEVMLFDERGDLDNQLKVFEELRTYNYSNTKYIDYFNQIFDNLAF